FLAALDQTIVATATPAVISSFGSLDQLSWVATSYLLTSTIAPPIAASLSDVFGRRPAALFALIIFMVGSAMCGGAQSTGMLMAGRGVAGLGGGTFDALGIIILNEILPPGARGKYQGLLSVFFSIGSVIGPLLGGVFVDHIGWRWVFLINLPLGAAAALPLAFLLNLPAPPGSTREKLKKVDYTGMVMITVGTVCVLLAASWGGQEYPWSHPLVISLLCVGLAILVAFVFVEAYWVKNPLMPLHIFRDRDTAIGFLHYFLIGITFMGATFYMPLWFQTLRGNTATEAGVRMLPMVASITVIIAISAVIVSATGYTVPIIALANALATAGFAMLSTLDIDSTTALEVGSMVVTGLGLGMLYQPSFFASVGSAGPADLAMIVAVLVFLRLLGGVFGMAVCGAIYNGVFSTRMRFQLPDLATEVGYRVLHSTCACNANTLSAHTGDPSYSAQHVCLDRAADGSALCGRGRLRARHQCSLLFLHSAGRSITHHHTTDALATSGTCARGRSRQKGQEGDGGRRRRCE
ncbi:major facilitator superfamily-domain-containing protein, partial [Thamnocephalis sphaerospora]